MPEKQLWMVMSVRHWEAMTTNAGPLHIPAGEGIGYCSVFDDKTLALNEAAKRNCGVAKVRLATEGGK